MAKKRKKGRAFKAEYYDYNLVAVVILLTCFGLVMLYSTSAYTALVESHNDMEYFAKQAIIGACSIVGALIISRWDYHWLYYLGGILYWLSLFLMFLVKFTPLGVEVNGARRWLNFGIDALQLMFYGGALAAAALFFTDNLSTAIIIGGITGFMIFIAHPNQKMFLKIMGVLAVVLIVGRIILQMTLGGIQIDMNEVENFRLKRVLVWLNPEQYSSAGGYQIMQALYAIGSGGFFGKGLGNSVQKLGPVPEAQNDMIFSIVCEELGVFGGLIVIVLFGYLLYRLFFIAQNAKDFYGSLMVSGIMVHIALQVVLNICVVLNWIPTTGITLPFVSYGGTSILFLMVEMGIALSVSRKIGFEKEKG